MRRNKPPADREDRFVKHMTAALTAAARLLLLLVVGLPRLLVRWIDQRKAANGVAPLTPFLRGSVYFFVWLCMYVAVALTVNHEPTTREKPGTAATAAVGSRAAPSTTSSRPAPQPQPIRSHVGDRVRIGRVIDGDTFELIGGQTVRVLGIDSCEMDTPGGEQAKIAARSVLGSTVWLTSEPGVDTDRYGRLLRYVQTAHSGDLGEYLVRDDHTGVYQGDNDASDAYLQRLYAHDLDNAANPPAGRDCGEPAPVVEDDAPVYVDTDDDDGRDRNWCRKWWC
jgi:endonuclease YncB( thermonuclease family)